MKKIFCLFLVFSSLILASVPSYVDSKIREYVKKNYDLDTHGAYTQKIIYDGEINAYTWIQKNATDKKTLDRVMRIYNPDTHGWYTTMIMYQAEIRNANW